MLVPLERPNFSVRFENEYQANAKKYLPYWEDFYSLCNKLKLVYNDWFMFLNQHFDFYGDTSLINGGWDWDSLSILPKAIDWGIKNSPQVIRILNDVARTGNPAFGSLEKYYTAPKTSFGSITASFQLVKKVLKKFAEAPKAVEEHWKSVAHLTSGEARKFKDMAAKLLQIINAIANVVSVIRPGSAKPNNLFG